MSGDTERTIREFCAWWQAQGHDATPAECERIARVLLAESATGPTQSDVDAYCAKLKRGFAGGRTILAASEVGKALVEWLENADGTAAAAPLDDGGPGRSGNARPAPGMALPDTGFDDTGFDDAGFDDAGFDDAGFDDAGFDDAGFDDDELSWGEGAGGGLLDGMSAKDLPPIPEEDDLPPLPTADDGPPLAAPDMSFEASGVVSLDERVDAIGGRDVFAASTPPGQDLDLQLDLDADMIGEGDKAHYVREEEMDVGGRDPGLDVDVDPNAPNAHNDAVLDLGAVDAGLDGNVDVPRGLAAGVPDSRAAAAPVGHATSSEPPTSDLPPDEDTREDLPALTTPPPPAPSRQPIIIGAVLVLLIVAAAAATFAL